MNEDYAYLFDTVFPKASGAQLYSHSVEAYNALFTFELAPTFPWFQGHYPDNPVLPGVIQLHSAIELGQMLFVKQKWPNKITKLKFKEMILPNAKIMLTLNFNPTRSLLKYCYEQPDQGNAQFAVGTIQF